MHLSSQEEYGLRCLLHIAQAGPGATTSIQEISRAEGISVPYTAKLMRVLREGGLVTSERGHTGGYHLARPAERITAKQALEVLGRDLYGGAFCERYSGHEDICTHTVNCSIRSLWKAVQAVVDELLCRTTLRDLLCHEREMDRFVNDLVVLTGATEPSAQEVSHA